MIKSVDPNRCLIYCGVIDVTEHRRTDGQPSTKERLLETAEELFAQRGLDGVSVRDLAAAADVNVAAVNYHYQSKENLYREVLVRRLQFKRDASLLAIRQSPRRADGTPELEPLIRAFVAQYLEETITSPGGRNFMRLITWEMHGPRPAGEAFLRELVVPIQLAFAEALTAAEPRLDRAQVSWIILSIVGQCIHIVMRYYKRNEEHLSSVRKLIDEFIPSVDTEPDEYVRLAVDFVTRFSVGGIGALAGTADTATTNDRGGRP